ncbi:cystatin-like [Pungitius pungitius]|uniref:cystatin-like n=1 Tax=Pungitius pungitius TaxID=134920 RepID=UPI002E1445B2
MLLFWWCVVLFASAGCSGDPREGMTGEPLRVPVNGTKVLRAAHFAVSEFNRVHAAERVAYKLVSITSAKIQVVAGVDYILDVLLGRTTCQSLSAADSEPCFLHPKANELECRFVVAEIPWEGFRALIKTKCHPYYD